MKKAFKDHVKLTKVEVPAKDYVKYIFFVENYEHATRLLKLKYEISEDEMVFDTFDIGTVHFTPCELTINKRLVTPVVLER